MVLPQKTSRASKPNQIGPKSEQITLILPAQVKPEAAHFTRYRLVIAGESAINLWNHIIL
jgi:hypothetical protein